MDKITFEDVLLCIVIAAITATITILELSKTTTP
jgi:hypothetical protein